MGDFCPEIFQSPMLSDVIGVRLRRLGGPNWSAQGCKPIVIAVVVTTMQTMSYPVRSLCPPPDIALECICQTALGFPASWRIIAPGSKQDSSIFRVVPRGTCKMQAQSRFLPTNHYAWWFTHVQKSLLSVNLYRKTSVCSYQVCIGLLKVYTFITGGISSEKTPGDMWTLYELSINLV